MSLKGIPPRIASSSSFASFFVAEAEGKFAIWNLDASMESIFLLLVHCFGF